MKDVLAAGKKKSFKGGKLHGETTRGSWEEFSEGGGSGFGQGSTGRDSDETEGLISCGI